MTVKRKPPIGQFWREVESPNIPNARDIDLAQHLARLAARGLDQAVGAGRVQRLAVDAVGQAAAAAPVPPRAPRRLNLPEAILARGGCVLNRAVVVV